MVAGGSVGSGGTVVSGCDVVAGATVVVGAGSVVATTASVVDAVDAGDDSSLVAHAASMSADDVANTISRRTIRLLLR